MKKLQTTITNDNTLSYASHSLEGALDMTVEQEACSMLIVGGKSR